MRLFGVIFFPFDLEISFAQPTPTRFQGRSETERLSKAPKYFSFSQNPPVKAKLAALATVTMNIVDFHLQPQTAKAANPSLVRSFLHLVLIHVFFSAPQELFHRDAYIAS